MDLIEVKLAVIAEYTVFVLCFVPPLALRNFMNFISTAGDNVFD